VAHPYLRLADLPVPPTSYRIPSEINCTVHDCILLHKVITTVRYLPLESRSPSRHCHTILGSILGCHFFSHHYLTSHVQPSCLNPSVPSPHLTLRLCFCLSEIHYFSSRFPCLSTSSGLARFTHRTMATIRIADDPHPNRKRLGSFDADSENVVPAQSIYQMSRLTRTGTALSDDGVVNIRSRVGSRRSLSISGDVEDEDPGLRRASDFNHAAVCTSTRTICYHAPEHRLIPAETHRKRVALVDLPVHRCHLWRYRNQPSLCLLVCLHRKPQQAGPCRCLVSHYLVSAYDGYAEIHHRNSLRRQRW